MGMRRKGGGGRVELMYVPARRISSTPRLLPADDLVLCSSGFP